MKYVNKINDCELEPMQPSESNRGGIYAEIIEDTANMAEVVVGIDGKAYVNILDTSIGGDF